MKKFCALTAAILLLSCCLPAFAEYYTTETPAPIPVIAKEDLTPTPEGIKHYMLICCDDWEVNPDKIDRWTDGLVLVTVDTIAQRVMLTSFIRDMLIQRPDGKFGRINNIVRLFGQNRAAVEMLVDTISTHFDIPIEKYIVVHFGQVERIVDAVGGVSVYLKAREAARLQSFHLGAASTEPALGGAGTYRLAGHAAVLYMRIRKVATVSGATQDLGRTERVRTVLTTIADSLKDVTYDEAMDLMDAVLNNITMTNMTTADFMEALTIAMNLRGTPVESIRMPIDGTYKLLPVSGMATQQIDYPENREALHDFLFGTSFAVID